MELVLLLVAGVQLGLPLLFPRLVEAMGMEKVRRVVVEAL
jgi:hypothetical protein